MRGADTFTYSLLAMRYLDDFVPANYPLRPIRVMVNVALLKMDALPSGMYVADIKGGRPSCPQETVAYDAFANLLELAFRAPDYGANLIQRAVPLVHRLAMHDDVWAPTVFAKNRAPDAHPTSWFPS